MKLINRFRENSHTNGKWWLLLAVLWYLLDQISKQIAQTDLKPIGSVSIIGDTLRLTYAENTGMAFSISLFPSWLLLLIAVFTSILVALWLVKVNSGILQNLAFALIIAGAMGNATDRVIHGFVIDFIDADFPDFIMHRWPIFNFADSGITVAMFLLVISSFFTQPESATQETVS